MGSFYQEINDKIMTQAEQDIAENMDFIMHPEKRIYGEWNKNYTPRIRKEDNMKKKKMKGKGKGKKSCGSCGM